LKNGVHGFYKCFRTLDSGFRRNDGKRAFSTFYQAIKFNIFHIKSNSYAVIEPDIDQAELCSTFAREKPFQLSEANQMNYEQTKQVRDRLKRRRESHIQNLREEAERLTKEAVKIGARKVILIGSLAGGNPALSSDLDLIIVIDSELDFLNRTASVYSRLKPRIGVDLLVYTPEEIKKMKNNPFLQRAMKIGRIIYEA